MPPRKKDDAGSRECLAGSKEWRGCIGRGFVGGGEWTGFFVWLRPRITGCAW